MSKRKATEDIYAPESRKRQDASADRAAEFTAHLQALNQQFAQWVQEQATSSSIQLWSAGVKDYVRYADKLLADFADILQDGNPGDKNIGSPFGNTPAAAAATPAASGRASDLYTGTANGPSGGGRKSVSFAPTPQISGAAEATAATPGATATHNTTDAGHTPAPASGLGFSFGATPGATPGAAAARDFGSPEPIKWGSTPNASDSTPGNTPGFGGTGGFTFGAVTTSSTPAASHAGSKPAGTADPKPATKAFSFGISSSSTPAAANSTAAGSLTAGQAASPVPPSTGQFSFGATPPLNSSSASPAAAASSSTPSSNFTFGALPSSAASGAAAATSSPPLFGVAATAATSAAAPGMFKFPAPAAPAGEEGAGDGDGAEDEAPAKYKPEITVDENTWNVFFNGKARLHVRRAKDGKTEWDPKGVGVLTVRQKKDGTDESAYITFTNDGGKQLVSSRLQKHTEVHIVPEKPSKCRISLTVISYELPPAAAGGGGAAAASTAPKYSIEVCMITLSTAEKMQELQKVVNEHKPK